MHVFLKILLYATSAFVLFWGWCIIHHMFQRILFVIKLKKAVEKHDGKLVLIRFPLLPFFCSYDGEDLRIETGTGQRILLKFFPYFLKGKTITLQDEASAMIQKNFVLFGGGAVASGGFVSSKFNDASSIFKIRKKKYSSVFSGEADEKIMLFSPAPASMRAVKNGQMVVLDNDVQVYHFVTFSATGLLKKITR